MRLLITEHVCSMGAAPSPTTGERKEGRPEHHVPSLSARSSRLVAATSTDTFGAGSPLAGPYSSGRATCAVFSPHCAAAARSLLCAATIMHSDGFKLNASAAAR